MAVNQPKKRIIISYDNMSQDLKDAFDRKYPHGYADYMGDIMKVDKPDGSCFHAVPFRPENEDEEVVEDVLYLVKINVNTDNVEEVEKELFEDQSDEGGGDSDGEVLPGNDNDFNTHSDDDSDEEE
ncbi:MAG: hypothetical protein J6X89_08505 [Bacteroidales bacterium]|nr:hypothetical protein [Bacteroidales bacterium]